MTSIAEIRRAVVRRFVPASSVIVGSVLFMIALREPGGLHWQGLAVGGFEIATPPPPAQSLDELEAEADAEIARLESLPRPTLVPDMLPGREKERSASAAALADASACLARVPD